MVLKEEKIYVPKDEALRVEIIWLYYDILVAGYRGRWKITELVITELVARSDKRCRGI